MFVEKQHINSPDVKNLETSGELEKLFFFIFALAAAKKGSN